MTETFNRHRFTRPSNFRDVAEQAAAELPMRRGVLFRSDHLGHLDEQDAKQIAALGLRRVLDFRGADERMEAVCALPGVAVHSLAIEPTVVQVLSRLMAAGHELTAEEVIGHMQDTYRDFVRHNTNRFAEFFEHLLASDEPTVFHCTAGKDRTGFAAALVLLALGASQETVMRDYLLTNERFKPSVPRGGGWLPPEAGAVLWSVQPDFLHAALETVEQDYGSMQAYLRDGLGLGEPQMRRLRELYLRD
jgi:protein-tyrosine phosphatase